MNDLPLVSIITPSYNQAQFLEETILSVLNQDYPNIEYWVIDGGSDDGSLDIIKKYADRLSGWVSEKDNGQADAINKGIGFAKGEVVAWLNSDDVYRPNAVASASQALAAHPQAGMVFSDVASIDVSGEVFNVMHYGDWGLTDLMSFKIIGQAGVFLRRSILNQACLLDPTYHYLLDHHLWLRIGLFGQIKYMPNIIWAAARMHAGAKNVAHAEQFGAEAYRLANWIEQEDAFKPYLDNNRNKIWAGAYRLDGFYLLDGGFPKQALGAYWKALKTHPPTALQDWKRILFAVFYKLELSRWREMYNKKRKKKFQDKSV